MHLIWYLKASYLRAFLRKLLSIFWQILVNLLIGSNHWSTRSIVLTLFVDEFLLNMNLKSYPDCLCSKTCYPNVLLHVLGHPSVLLYILRHTIYCIFQATLMATRGSLSIWTSSGTSLVWTSTEHGLHQNHGQHEPQLNMEFIRITVSIVLNWTWTLSESKSIWTSTKH